MANFLKKILEDFLKESFLCHILAHGLKRSKNHLGGLFTSCRANTIPNFAEGYVFNCMAAHKIKKNKTGCSFYICDGAILEVFLMSDCKNWLLNE